MFRFKPHNHDRSERRFARGEHSHEHGGRGERGRRGGLGRFFAHGDLRLVILHLIAEKPRHGYEIIKEIEDRVGGSYTPSPGVIYPTLTLLEELGYVTVTPGEGAKKLHGITEAGQLFLDANRTTLDPVLAKIDEAKRTTASKEAPPVLRAMENLKMALRLRMERGPLTAEQIRAVAAVLDAAATSVEGV
jgi:DNA-binding PadR family transcriptional regulator